MVLCVYSIDGHHGFFIPSIRIPNPEEYELDDCIRGVVTHTLNDALTGEFDDLPVM